MIQFEPTGVSGLIRLNPKRNIDDRGSFVKLIHQSSFASEKLRVDIVETYYTTSRRNVIRGMHFQLPPYDHDKIVFCITGEVLDVVVDLRSREPSFKAVRSFRLLGEAGHGLYVPAGCAHGFLTLSESASLIYFVSSEYAPEADTGVRWDSLPFIWPVKTPVVSARDRNFVEIERFSTPF